MRHITRTPEVWAQSVLETLAQLPPIGNGIIPPGDGHLAAVAMGIAAAMAAERDEAVSNVLDCQCGSDAQLVLNEAVKRIEGDPDAYRG